MNDKLKVHLNLGSDKPQRTLPPPPPLSIPSYHPGVKRVSALLLFFFIFNRPARHTIYRQNANVLEMHPGLHERVGT